MKIIVKILVIIILIANIPNKCIAQDSVDRKAFISLNSGVFLPSASNFKKVYNSPCTFINGISIGIPITNEDFFFYIKAMYFQKNGTPITYHFERDSITGEFYTYTTQEGNVVYKQWLGNIGIQYNLNFGQTNNFIFNGGVTLIKLSERIKNSTAGDNAKGLNGLFFGIGYEKIILEKFSLFSEVQYNFDMRKFQILGYDIHLKYGGANFNVGMRYYFSQK